MRTEILEINGFTYTEDEVIEALRNKGYLILPWVLKYEDETFPSGVELIKIKTKVALKGTDMPCEKNIWTNVAIREFQKEMKKPKLI